MRGKQARRMNSRAYRALFDNGALKKQKKTSGILGLSASSASVTTCRPGLSHNSPEALEVRSNKENVNLSKSEKSLYSLLKLDIATVSETPTLPKDFSKSIQDIEKKCTKQMNKLLEKQQKEKEVVQGNYNDAKTQLDKKKITERAIIRRERKGAMGANQLRLLEDKCAEMYDRLRSQIENRLIHLEERHVAAREQLLERKSRMIEELKSWPELELGDVGPVVGVESFEREMLHAGELSVICVGRMGFEDGPGSSVLGLEMNEKDAIVGSAGEVHDAAVGSIDNAPCGVIRGSVIGNDLSGAAENDTSVEGLIKHGDDASGAITCAGVGLTRSDGWTSSENASVCFKEILEKGALVSTAQSVVSGDNLSLYVDFSAYLDGTNCSNLSPMPIDELPSEGTGGQDSNKKSSWIFQAGDPVWIRTKNQSWWPGKICGQGNGSENPSEVDQMNCLLVSYLGTTHTVWCLRIHLKPFHENFEHMEGQNKARSYIEAVEKAAAEFGNLLKPVMSCSCDLETKVEGSLVGQKVGRFEKFSASHFEPQNLLLQLKDWAKSGSRLNLLELTVMKARLYVFYKFVGRNQLPMNQLKKLSKKNGSLPGEETSATPLEDSRKDGETCGSDPSSNKRKRRQKKFFVIEGIDAAKDLL